MRILQKILSQRTKNNQKNKTTHRKGDGDMIETIGEHLQEMHHKRENGQCPFCGKDMTNPTFRDEQSKKEFKISGICQECQDNYFKGE